MRFALALPALVACALAGASCRTSAVTACRPGEVASIMDSLYFGTAKPNGDTVRAEQWQEFLASEITARFPDGLTAWSASGQWRDGNGVLQRESSYVLFVVHPDTPEQDRAVEEVIDLYKARFDQQAVLRVRTNTCASF